MYTNRELGYFTLKNDTKKNYISNDLRDMDF